jgi:uncharacterized protein (TIGR03067 family)
MMRTRLRLFILAVLSLAFAPAPLPKPNSTKADLQSMQGEWVRTLYTTGGKPATTAVSNVVIFNNHLRYGSTPGSDEWIITLDARKKPKVFDIRSTRDKSVYLGVYRLEKDTLKVWSCAGADESKRPLHCDASRPGVCFEVFQRRKR